MAVHKILTLLCRTPHSPVGTEVALPSLSSDNLLRASSWLWGSSCTACWGLGRRSPGQPWKWSAKQQPAAQNPGYTRGLTAGGLQCPSRWWNPVPKDTERALQIWLGNRTAEKRLNTNIQYSTVWQQSLGFFPLSKKHQIQSSWCNNSIFNIFKMGISHNCKCINQDFTVQQKL